VDPERRDLVLNAIAERPPFVSRSRACEALGVSRAVLYPDLRKQRKQVRKRGGGLRRNLSPAEREQALAVMHEERFCDQAPRQIYATLLGEGLILASISTLYRLLRVAGETAERRAQRPAQKHAVPRLSAERPNQVWSWDITRLPTPEAGVFLFLYLILDLYSRYVVGWMVSTKENGGLARQLFQETLAAHGVEPKALTVHQDRGAPMVAETYRDLLDATGVDLSYSRPRVSNDNPYSEAHFKTLKYRPDYPGRFASADEARTWITQFVSVYHDRAHQGLRLYSPAEVFHGQVDAVHAIRQKALDAHYAAHPERYPKGPPKAHRPPGKVTINPLDAAPQTAEKLLAELAPTAPSTGSQEVNAI
jgi:putative transposase